MSFNTLGSKAWDFGGNTPVWLGKVRPVPFGGTLKKAYLIQNALYQAGMPVNLSADTNGEITPVVAFKVTTSSQPGSGTGDTITVRPCGGIVPSTDTVLMKLGTNFTTKGKAYKPSKVVRNASNPTLYDLSFTESQLGTLAEGDVLVEGASEGASVAPAAVPNGYLYNDICLNDIDVTDESACATGAVVKFHGEGLLIDRNPAGALLADKLQSLIPNVLLIKGV